MHVFSLTFTLVNCCGRIGFHVKMFEQPMCCFLCCVGVRGDYRCLVQAYGICSLHGLLAICRNGIRIQCPWIFLVCFACTEFDNERKLRADYRSFHVYGCQRHYSDARVLSECRRRLVLFVVIVSLLPFPCLRRNKFCRRRIRSFGTLRGCRSIG